jgi:hypothetical protein
MDTPRTVYKVDPGTPGSDVAAETAAALAAASLVFRKSDPAYASRLLARAKRVFAFADKHRGSYSTGLAADVCPYYCSYSGYQDELLWGAAWLHRATKSPSYLGYIQANGQVLGAGESDNTFGWDNKHAGARVLIAKSFLVQRLGALHEYKSHADAFICSMVPGTPTDQTQYTRGGLLFKLSDSNMQYVTSSAFLLLTYAKYLAFARQTVSCGGGGGVVTPQRLRAIARRQVDYLLGSNPAGMSYMGRVRGAVPAARAPPRVVAAVGGGAPGADRVLAGVRRAVRRRGQPERARRRRCGGPRLAGQVPRPARRPRALGAGHLHQRAARRRARVPRALLRPALAACRSDYRST